MRLACETKPSIENGKPELVFSSSDNGNFVVISEERLADVLKQAGYEETKDWLVKIVDGSHGPLSEAEADFVKSFVAQPAA